MYKLTLKNKHNKEIIDTTTIKANNRIEATQQTKELLTKQGIKNKYLISLKIIRQCRNYLVYLSCYELQNESKCI